MWSVLITGVQQSDSVICIQTKGSNGFVDWNKGNLTGTAEDYPSSLTRGLAVLDLDLKESTGRKAVTASSGYSRKNGELPCLQKRKTSVRL
ncbi:hypothetical protein CapIbe_018755 [Capra ibex]